MSDRTGAGRASWLLGPPTVDVRPQALARTARLVARASRVAGSVDARPQIGDRPDKSQFTSRRSAFQPDPGTMPVVALVGRSVG